MIENKKKVEQVAQQRQKISKDRQEIPQTQVVKALSKFISEGSLSLSRQLG